jgi:hypothetical protein
MGEPAEICIEAATRLRPGGMLALVNVILLHFSSRPEAQAFIEASGKPILDLASYLVRPPKIAYCSRPVR